MKTHVISSLVLAAAIYGLILRWLYGEFLHEATSLVAFITMLSMFSGFFYPLVLFAAFNLTGTVLAIMHGKARS